VALTAAAVATEKLVVGTGIALVPQRDPILTAKEVVSLDLVSEGRFRFGVGVGWLREEIANHGVDPSVRGRVVDERLRAMIEIWTQEKAEFHGDFVNFDPIYSWPKPATKPYPPLYLGGGPASFKRIARLKAGWIAMAPSPDVLSGQLEELRAVAGQDVPVINIHMGDRQRKPLRATVISESSTSWWSWRPSPATSRFAIWMRCRRSSQNSRKRSQVPQKVGSRRSPQAPAGRSAPAPVVCHTGRRPHRAVGRPDADRPPSLLSGPPRPGGCAECRSG